MKILLFLWLGALITFVVHDIVAERNGGDKWLF